MADRNRPPPEVRNSIALAKLVLGKKSEEADALARKIIEQAKARKP